VRRETVNRWNNDPDVRREVNRIARDELGKDLSEVYGTLRKLAIKGSFQHMKLYLELLKEYREEVNVNVNDSRASVIERLNRIAQEDVGPAGNGTTPRTALPNLN